VKTKVKNVSGLKMQLVSSMEGKLKSRNIRSGFCSMCYTSV
jgi:hypothetical protein